MHIYRVCVWSKLSANSEAFASSVEEKMMPKLPLPQFPLGLGRQASRRWAISASPWSIKSLPTGTKMLNPVGLEGNAS